MASTKEQKQNILKNLKEKIDEQKSMVFVDFKGVKVKDLSGLRKKLKKAGCVFIVAKKTLFGISFKEKGLDINTKGMDGQLGIVFGLEDEISPAKLTYEFSKGNENVKILGGYFENKIQDASAMIVLAQIPSREELLAKMVGSIAAPMSGFVNVLQGNIRGLVQVLGLIKK